MKKRIRPLTVKGGNRMAKESDYNAFISYRHLPLDQAVAERTQKLLENYRAPRSLGKGKKRRIERIFRDQTELPTSGDLDDALQRALLTSDFLIVVLSRELKNSRWCMEEIRTFKRAHGGKISHILPILAEGEPSESIPDILLHETRKILREDGSEELIEVDVEPLCCDVRAGSVKGSLKKLRTEFLRLAAPMLGVGYDDLYQRHMRMFRRRVTAIAASTVALLLSVLSVISYFAYQTYQAQQRYQSNLVDTYAQQGAAQITNGDWEQAMMYYGKALELDDETQAAKTGALLLLQQHGWLNRVGSGSGRIAGEIVYETNSYPSAVDETGDKQLLCGLSSIRMTDRAGNLLADLSDYGDFLSSAQDGSCWTFASEDAITFFFPEDGASVQVERPYAIHPQCDLEELADFGEFDPKAMALDRDCAVVCYGGYLYVYQLDIAGGQSSLIETFDLVMVFGRNGIPSMFPWVWVDAGGSLTVISSGSVTAVLSVKNSYAPCLNALYEAYGWELQSVAFSSDGQCYALAYGNDDGIYDHPGGCLEVYDQHSDLLMATEFDGGTPLAGAMFEPDGDRIAAWGSGEVQVWNWADGTPAAAPLQVQDVSSAAWLEDGRLAVSYGKDEIDYYTLVRFEADSGDLPALEGALEENYRQMEVELSTGLRFSSNYSRVTVTDPQGNQIDTKRLEELDLGIELIDRIYLDKQHDTVYAWYSMNNFLLAFKADETGIASVSEINTRGKKPLALYSVWNGVLAEMGTGELIYYPDGETQPAGILEPSTVGSVFGIASDENGLVSFVIRGKNYLGGPSYEDVYSVELWDLNKIVMLAELEANSRKAITGLTFTDDNRLAFAVRGETVVWLLDAPTPDGQLIETLQNISCYQLDEAQNTRIVPAAFDPRALGNWDTLLRIPTGEAPEEEETFSERMNGILETQGEDAWLEAYAAWWDSAEPESIGLSELCDIMDDFFQTARNIDREGEIRGALERFLSIAREDEGKSLADSLKVDYLICDMLFYTPENVDLEVENNEKQAVLYEERLETSGDVNDLLYGYISRVMAGVLQGRGTAAFEIQDDPTGGLYAEFEEDFMTYGLNMYKLLLDGRPEEAAAACDDLVKLDSVPEAYWSPLREFSGYVRLGIIPQSVYSEFVGSLKYPTGLRLAQVTNEQLRAGLRLGDVVIAINGVNFGIPQYLMVLQKESPEAVYTVLRDDGTVFTTDAVNWRLSGRFAT